MPLSIPGLELCLDPVPESVAIARRRVSGFAAAHGADDPSDVALAVSEICSNVVLHAYRDGSAGDLEVRARVGCDGTLVVNVRDDGCGMSPRTDSPGVGLGLPIAAAVADEFEVRRPRDGGTEVSMVFAFAGG